MVMATTSPPCAWRSSTAFSSARTSNELTSVRTPSRFSVLVAGSNCNAETTGTCLMQTAIRIGNYGTGNYVTGDR